MLLINFAGQPGAGKTSAAAGVFYQLKKNSWNVEIVSEYTKELIHQDDKWRLADELIVFAEKYARIKRLSNVDLVITDSCLVSSMVYGGDQFGQTGMDFFEQVSGSFDNIYFMVDPISRYVTYGRMADEQQAKHSGEYMELIIDKMGAPKWHITSKEDDVMWATGLIEGIAVQKGYVKFHS